MSSIVSPPTHANSFEIGIAVINTHSLGFFVIGTACDEQDIPDHVKQPFISGNYHGGQLDQDYDNSMLVMTG